MTVTSGAAGEPGGKRRRIRLDVAVMEQGLATSRERARALILAGKVLVDGQVIDKPGTLVRATQGVALKASDHPYVGRGGVKLQGALEEFGVAVARRVCLDLGASTGGFTDCLLHHGAALVYAVDVGRGQLDARLRADPRVVVMERTHVRTLRPADFPDRPDLATVDLSFISLSMVLPLLPPLLTGSGEVLALVKPQFEVGKGQVGRGGVVRDPAHHREAVLRVGRLAVELGFRILGAAPSRLLGPKGNREFFLHLGRPCPKQGRPEPPEPVEGRRIRASIDPEEAAERAVRQ